MGTLMICDDYRITLSQLGGVILDKFLVIVENSRQGKQKTLFFS